MGDKEISSAVIGRLPRYYRYLGELRDKGVVRISSKELSERMKVTASQIRQDFNNFGGFGQQGYGYNVEYLYEEIGKILGLTKKYHMIIIGAGNLGQALAKHTSFEQRGFVLKGIFDVKPKLDGVEIRGIPIRMMEELQVFIKEQGADIAAITTPPEVAREIASKLYRYGVRGFWNFAHTDLHLPEDAVVENMHLAESLMRLSYALKNV
jgi:redox-sensing transcriptional repressor